MKQMKRKKLVWIAIVFFVVVFISGVLMLRMYWGNPHAVYKNYNIIIKKNTYCEKTQTGHMDIQIKRHGGKKAKLLQTEFDLKKSQSFQVVQDSYEFEVAFGSSVCVGNIYEQKYAGGTQYLTLYYVNYGVSEKKAKMQLVLKDKKHDKEVANIKTSPKIKNDSRRFVYREKEIYLSQEGMMLDAGEDSEFSNSQAMKSGIMTVRWKNGTEKQVQLSQDADLSEYKVEDIIMPKLIYNEEPNVESNAESAAEDVNDTRYYYVMELNDWENISEIRMGENVFEKTKKIDNKKRAEKKKENETENKVSEKDEKTNTFYTKDISLLDQPEAFKISDYYITNRVVAGNRYYVDDNHVLWGQGMNYYAQLGINHPEDVGNWYHAEYTEPQKIAENVVHVDASENGYFVMYLTENGELYGAGANLCGVMCEEVGENDVLNPEKNVVNKPKLLMSDVSYVRTGATSAVVLKNNGEVYWWGELMFAGMSSIYGEGTLVYTEPHKMLDQAIYVTTASGHVAAIKENGDLYTWGNNSCGQCGYTGGKSLLREPEKVMEQVRMVWCDDIEQNSAWKDLTCVNPDDYNATSYDNTFVLTKDGQLYGAGTNIGSEEKRNTPYGEGEDDERSDMDKWTIFSTKFLKIKVDEYAWNSDPSEVYTGEKEIQIEGTAAEGLAE